MDGLGGTVWGTAPTWQVALTGSATGALLGLSAASAGGWILFFPFAAGVGWAAWRTGRQRALPWLLGGLGGVLVAPAAARGGAWAVACGLSLLLCAVVAAVQVVRWRRTWSGSRIARWGARPDDPIS